MEQQSKKVTRAVNHLGEKHITNQGYEVEIIEYFKYNNCTIKFNNGVIKANIQYNRVLIGTIKNPYHPSVCGVGYFGVGVHKSKINGITPKKYDLWRDILRRCYDENALERCPTYKEVVVCKEWECFQNFGDWFDENYNHKTMKIWDLDKDVLFKGNKVYSAETCCFVPKEINNLFLKKKVNRGSYPIGVHKENSKYVAQISRGTSKKQTIIGRYNTIEEAFQAYKIAKEEYIKEVADKWKDQITEPTYQALYNYTVEITD